MTTNDKQSSNRLEAYLAYVVVVLVAASVVAFFAVLIAGSTGMHEADFAHGLWPIVTVLPWFALPVGFLVLIFLLIFNGVRRRRETRSTH